MADETERECARLFRVNRTIHELVKDRVSPFLASLFIRQKLMEDMSFVSNT